MADALSCREPAAGAELLVSVIVPICNEEAILRDTLTKLTAHFDGIVGCGAWNFIIVENGSTDRSNEIARQFVESCPTSRLITLREAKVGEAVRQGFAATVAPWAHVINIEQWDIPFFRWAWQRRERYDLILGSKRADPTLNQQSPSRKLLSYGLNAILGYFFEYTGADTHGPKLLKMSTMRGVLEQTRLALGQYDTEFTLRALRSGLWIAEVPTIYIEHRPPRNAMATKIFRNAVELVRLRSLMRSVPWTSPVRFHRWSRSDVSDRIEDGQPPSHRDPGRPCPEYAVENARKG
jgi:glycosyltransferase involved in cell wall biosynthesis